MKSNKNEAKNILEEVSENLARLTTKRKNRSGSQRRRSKKMNQNAARDALQEISETPSTSSEAGKRIRAPYELNTVDQKSKKKQSSPHLRKSDKPCQPFCKGWGSKKNTLKKAARSVRIQRRWAWSRNPTQSLGFLIRRTGWHRVGRGLSYAKVAKRRYD